MFSRVREMLRCVCAVVIVGLVASFVLCSRTTAVDREFFIETTHAPDGYISVFYPEKISEKRKMKVGMEFDGQTTFYDYVAGDCSVYAFTYGDGIYTITLYQNIEGTLYRKVSCLQVEVRLISPLSPFLISTREVMFEDDDIVSQTAADVCGEFEHAMDKIIAIHQYIHTHLSYDYVLAKLIQDGQITNYTPVATDVLQTQTGICYDYAVLFAAMCRSQGIPCIIQKGDYKGAYHAWNSVYVDGKWYDIDSLNVLGKDFLDYIRRQNDKETKLYSKVQIQNMKGRCA